MNMEKGTKNVEQKWLDLAFMLDTTYSMSHWIDSLKEEVKNIIDDLISKSNQRKIRVALILFRDHCDESISYLVQATDFTSDVSEIFECLQSATANGGGDVPEAMADAMYHCFYKLSWADNAQKVAFMLTDTLPHGLFESVDDSFREGCPCGHDPIKLSHQMANESISLFVLTNSGHQVRFWSVCSYITGGKVFIINEADQKNWLRKPIVDCVLEDSSVDQLMTRIHEEVAKEAELHGEAFDETKLTRRLQAAMNMKNDQNVVVVSTGMTNFNEETDLNESIHFQCLMDFNHHYDHRKPARETLPRKTTKKTRKVYKAKITKTKEETVKMTIYSENPPLRKSLRLMFKTRSLKKGEDVPIENKHTISSFNQSADERNNYNQPKDQKNETDSSGSSNINTGTNRILRRAVRKAVAKKTHKK